MTAGCQGMRSSLFGLEKWLGKALELYEKYAKMIVAAIIAGEVRTCLERKGVYGIKSVTSGSVRRIDERYSGKG